MIQGETSKFFNMKYFLIFTLLIFSLLNLNGQIEIAYAEYNDEFRQTKTVVFMPAMDTVKTQIYRKTLEAHWKLTPLEFLSYQQYTDRKYQKGYSYLLFGDDLINDGQTISSYVYFELWMWHANINEWEKRKKAQLAKIELYPDPETTFHPDHIYDYRFGTQGHIFNWCPGFFKNYIQMINRYIEKGELRSEVKAYKEVPDLEKLKTSTLYIPKYVLDQHSPEQDILPSLSEKELISDYKYNYKFVSTEELSQLILDSKEPIFYLLFTRSNSDKYVNVVEGHEGKCVYSKHTAQSYNMKKSDLQKLYKTMNEQP